MRTINLFNSYIHRVLRQKNHKTQILFVGHDFKFLQYLIDDFLKKKEFEVSLFSYKGHTLKNIPLLKKMLPSYDIIFCEWGLDNIKWMSENKLKHQKLMVRIHLQEFETGYLALTKWENVDTIIFINRYQMNRFIELFPKVESKCMLIYNLIDCNRLNLDKDINAKYTLGLLGILPARKSPHIALRILSEIRKYDQRYQLSIKSKRPEELDWLWKRPSERAYYDEFFSSIDKLNISDAVDFEPHGKDVPEWFRKIGFIMSTSEFEGSHQSIAEGMASGSVPVIRNWAGSEMIYPQKYIYESIDEAVNLIRKMTEKDTYSYELDHVTQYARQHFDLNVIIPQYEKLITTHMQHE